MELPGKASEVDVPLQKISYEVEALPWNEEKQHFNKVKFNFNCQQTLHIIVLFERSPHSDTSN